MDHHAERKARKQKKREEKLRQERIQKDLKAHGPTAELARKEKWQMGRYNIFLLVGLVLVAMAFVFAHLWA